MENQCPFCTMNESAIIMKNDTCYAVYDIFPATEGHVLVIPFRHSASFFDYTKDEVANMWDLVNECKKYLDDKYAPNGYNIGMNIGESAGQTVFHLHIHIIPRRKGDVENPRGGIRHAVKGKGDYKMKGNSER
jgi:diadenosine tetraphosphate (Ap4A) HIT family hydrolase